MLGGERCHRFQPGLRAADLSQMSHIGESPQRLLPRIDVGSSELLRLKLRAQRIEQSRRLRTVERVAENPEILRAEPFRAALANVGITVEPNMN